MLPEQFQTYIDRAWQDHAEELTQLNNAIEVRSWLDGIIAHHEARTGDACLMHGLKYEASECFRLINNLAQGVNYAGIEKEYLKVLKKAQAEIFKTTER